METQFLSPHLNMEIEQNRKTHRTLLLDEFASRKGRNPRYSLRAFARDVGISPTSLSQVLSEKRKLSKKNILRIAERLALSPQEVANLLSHITRNEPNNVEQSAFLQIQDDTFRMMSDWYYFAILSLSRLPTNKANPDWVAKRLGISAVEAATAVERLQRLGFLEVAKGKLRRTAAPLTTTTDIPSAALRKFHKQNLRLAELAIEQEPIQRREVTSITMAIDPALLPSAKKRIIAFRNKLCDFLESGSAKEVYTLALQLFPLTKKGDSQ